MAREGYREPSRRCVGSDGQIDFPEIKDLAHGLSRITLQFWRLKKMCDLLLSSRQFSLDDIIKGTGARRQYSAVHRRPFVWISIRNNA